MGNRQVLIIGLDGLTFDLLDPLVDRGLLPHLALLRAKSYQSVLRSTVPPVSAPAWTSLITGVNPGKHGILQFVSLKPDQADAGEGDGLEVFPGGMSLLNANSIQSRTLWELLSQAGKRQVIVNVPMTYPPRPISGTMITGMMTPPSATVFTYPQELSQELVQAGYEIDLSVAEKEFDYNPQRLIERLREVLNKRSDTAQRLLQDETWDFAMVVFTGTDRLLHRFWKYIVPGNAEYDSPEAAELRPRLEQYLQDMDRAVAQLTGMVGESTTTFIVSDHGFGPVSAKTVHRLSMMKALGLSKAGSMPAVVRLRAFVEGYLGLTPDQVRKAARYVLPKRWVNKLEAQTREAQLNAGAQQLAYSVTLHEYVGGIYLNHERLSDQVGTFRRQVISALEALQDPETRTPLVARVYGREDLYSGPISGEFPDIVFYLRPGYGLSGGIGRGGRLVTRRKRAPQQQGTHRAEGILFIHGPNIEPVRGPEKQLFDVTATTLYLLGLGIPIDMDGAVIEEAISRSYLKDVSIRRNDADLASPLQSSEDETDQEDLAELASRLRALGYIE